MPHQNISASLKDIVPQQRLILHGDDRIKLYQNNSLSLVRLVSAVVKPQNITEVKKLVQCANEKHFSLYPISCGLNVGYGERTPVSEGCVVVDMSLMNKIRRYSARERWVEVEPGVTQGQLAEFLQHQDTPAISDTTGAGRAASVVGNVLEGGFGHTSLGFRRKEIISVEMVTGQGHELSFETGLPVGPDINPLFIQSNFGIVTALRLPVQPPPESVLTFVAILREEKDLGELLHRLAELKLRGVIRGCPHVGNAVRALHTIRPREERSRRTQALSNVEARLELKKPGIVPGLWSCIGGLDGSASALRSYRQSLKKSIGPIAKLLFFNDNSLLWFKRIVELPGLRSTELFSFLRVNVQTLNYVHSLSKGIPADDAMNNAGWSLNENSEEQIAHYGVMWMSFAFPGLHPQLESEISVIEEIFLAHGFDMPLTLTVLNSRIRMAVFNIEFDKADQEAVSRARDLKRTLMDHLAARNIFPYRLGIDSMTSALYQEVKQGILKAIKAECDPNGLISPERYGIRL